MIYMGKMKRWVGAMLAAYGLLLGLSGALSAQGQEAQLAEALRFNQQVIQLYQAGRYAEAIPLAERALAICEKALGREHRDVAVSLSSLAELYRAQGDRERAALLHQRALTIREKALGLERIPMSPHRSTIWCCCTAPKAITGGQLPYTSVP